MLLLSLFTACHNAPSKDNKADVVDEKSKPDDKVQRYIGLFSYGSKGSFFRPCGRDSARWAVIDSSGEMAMRYKTVYQYGYDNQ